MTRREPWRARPWERLLSGVGLLGLVLLGTSCAPAALLIPVRTDGERVAVADRLPASDYERLARIVSALFVTELGLPLPPEFTVFVYPTEDAYRTGLIEAGGMSPHRATQVASYSVGLGQHRRLFLNDGSLRNGALRQRLAVVAHELAHLAQYELAGGRRGGSEQWLREGMADWIACWVLERLGERTPACRRDDALLAVASELPTPSDASVDLVDLGRPLGWVARHPPAGNELTYRLAFLLTDRLVRQYGLSAVTTYFRSFADRDDRFGNFERAFGRPLAEFEHAALLEIRLELEARSSEGDAALRVLPTPSER